MQTLTEITGPNNTTTIVPIPIDLISYFIKNLNPSPPAKDDGDAAGDSAAKDDGDAAGDSAAIKDRTETG